MLTNAQANTEGCLAFLISYTGETEDIIEVAQTLRRLHVTTVALTSSTSNSLASQCDYKLRVDSSESWDRLGGMSSRISTLSIIDALFAALLNTNYDAQYGRYLRGQPRTRGIRIIEHNKSRRSRDIIRGSFGIWSILCEWTAYHMRLW